MLASIVGMMIQDSLCRCGWSDPASRFLSLNINMFQSRNGQPVFMSWPFSFCRDSRIPAPPPATGGIRQLNGIIILI